MNDIQRMIAQLTAPPIGMTQEAIADYIGVGQPAISKLAIGKRNDMLHSNALKLRELFESKCVSRPKRDRRIAA